MNINELSNQIVNSIKENFNKLVLPRQPALVVRLNTILSDDRKSNKDIVNAIKTDPAVTARVLQLANSPLIRGSQKIKSLQAAITRLGVSSIKNIIYCLSLKDNFKAKDGLVKNILDNEWEHMIRVAAYAAILAKRTPNLLSDEALVIGLIYRIGVLPVIDHVTKLNGLSEEQINQVLDEAYQPISMEIIKQWSLPDEYINIVKVINNLTYSNSSKIDYADILIIANAYAMLDSKKLQRVNWYSMPAMAKLNLTSKEDLDTLFESAKTEINDIKKLIA